LTSEESVKWIASSSALLSKNVWILWAQEVFLRVGGESGVISLCRIETNKINFSH